jgi:hypothetical protein
MHYHCGNRIFSSETNQLIINTEHGHSIFQVITTELDPQRGSQLIVKTGCGHHICTLPMGGHSKVLTNTDQLNIITGIQLSDCTELSELTGCYLAVVG